ncbi:MAG: twin-arginine translocation signal domain-containing protein, partial [Phycisphaerales bacterium]
MKNGEITSGCACCRISRRKFLAGCAACVGTAGFLNEPKPLMAAKKGRMRIRIIYSLHAVKQPGPDWPNIGFDFGPVMARINRSLTDGC